jgi:hypothetical protein
MRIAGQELQQAFFGLSESFSVLPPTHVDHQAKQGAGKKVLADRFPSGSQR